MIYTTSVYFTIYPFLVALPKKYSIFIFKSVLMTY